MKKIMALILCSLFGVIPSIVFARPTRMRSTENILQNVENINVDYAFYIYMAACGLITVVLAGCLIGILGKPEKMSIWINRLLE